MIDYYPNQLIIYPFPPFPLGSTLAISISVGISLTYVIGALFHWVIVAWIFIGIATLMCVGLYFIPESPYWLVQQDYMDEARDTIKVYYLGLIFIL